MSDAWLAGLLEGEGSFYVSRGASREQRRPLLVVKVLMTDRDVLDTVQSMTSGAGKVNGPYHRGGKAQYVVTLYGAAAEDCMRRVLPYMHARRAAKIEECLATPNLSHYPKEGI